MSDHQGMYPTATMCRLLGVSSSGYHAWVKRRPSQRAQSDAALIAEIRAAHVASRGTYGAPRLHAELAAKGLRVGRKRVARLMSRAGLAGVSRRKFVTTTVKDGSRQAPDLVERNFTAEAPDRLWVADITYIPTWAGFVYLAVVLDAYSRRIVGWSMATTLATQLVLDALDMALVTRRPSDGVVHHSDQGTQYTSINELQMLRLGLNRKIDWPGSPGWKPNTDITDPESKRWEIHGQTTYLPQGYPAFRAPYSGTNSLAPAPQAKATWSNSLYLNARLWEGGELYFNPELLQGFGLSDTLVVAGFPNGEAQKSNFPYPHYNTSRLYVRQTFGFGGEQEELASGQQQLAGKADVNRLTLQAGKFSVGDVFDGNSYAKDTRRDFLNWSIWAPGAFDYAADKLGLTYGMTAELNQKNWALRGGYFLMGAVSNSNNFDTQVFRRGQYVAELETRYTLFSRPGKLRTIGWVSSANSGSYRDTLNDPALNMDIALTRTGRPKYGYVFNVEQSVTDDIGLFGRWSWNNGKTEIMSFTDIDASLSLGTSIKGTSYEVERYSPNASLHAGWEWGAR